MSNDDLPVIFLLGPTASGKTEVAMSLVQQMPADIISVDSAMIYKDMNIGTAKPTAGELALAPHALIDILDPSQSWSVGEFCDSAYQEISKSHERNRIPVLTGGTMMYFRALEHGLAELPAANPEVRAEIDNEALQLGWPQMHTKLAQIDPASAARIHPNDAQRIQRALEVFKLTGIALSELQSAGAKKFPYKLIKCALVSADREQLHYRIGQRFKKMIEAGFVEEVRSLFERGDLHERMPSIRSVGYRQLWQFLDGVVSYETACENAVTATRQLAKRQMTWIRSDQNLHSFSGKTPEIVGQIHQMCGKD